MVEDTVLTRYDEADPSVYPLFVSLLGIMWWWCRLGIKVEIEHSLRVLSKHSSWARQEHYDQLLHVLRWCFTTRNFTLRFKQPKKNTPVLAMYVDSGFANWKPEMQSWCGYIGVFYGNLLFFASLLQPEQALSTGQAEFTAASMGCRPLLAFANLYLRR
jgi:hypothetical protein